MMVGVTFKTMYTFVRFVFILEFVSIWMSSQHDVGKELSIPIPCQLRWDVEAVHLDAAIAGTFTIAFWLKANASQMGGSFFDYLYSHSAYGVGNSMSSFAPNSINIYLPEQDHPAFGLVRSVVKDDNDNDSTSYLDSDGAYDNNDNRTDLSQKHVTDGNWHFVTLTSRLDEQKGFMMYIDGSLAAQASIARASCFRTLQFHSCSSLERPLQTPFNSRNAGILRF